MFGRGKQDPPPGVNPQYSSFSYQTNAGFNPPDLSHPSQPPAGQPPQKHKRGVPGGGWADGGNEETLRRPGAPPVQSQSWSNVYNNPSYSTPAPTNPTNPPQNYSTPSYPPGPPRAEPPPQPLAVSTEPGLYETQLVNQITQPGGVRPRPPDKDLREFVNKCKYLDCSTVSQILLEKLSEQPRALKSLHVILSLVQQFDNYRSFMSSYASVISQAEYGVQHQQVINQILSSLGVSAPATQVQDLIFQ